MDVSTIHIELRSKITRNFYIFSGDEWAVQKIYINQISKVSNKELKRADKVTDIKATNKHSLVPASYVYVVRDDKDFITQEKLQEGLSRILGSNIVILLLTTVDKRTKFYKKYKDEICEFQPLKPDVLKKYLQREIDLSDANYNKLMDICEYDYGRCLLEIDKIKHHAKATKAENMLNNVFELLVFDGTIYQPPKDAIFDFIDAVLDRRLSKCWDLYNQCLAVGEATLVMVSVLYTNAKAVLQVQSCESKDVGKATGLTGWQIMNAKKHLNKYRNGELINIMKLCTKMEKGIKTGTINEKYAMEYIMVNVL